VRTKNPLGGEDCGYFDSYSISPPGLTAVVLSPSNNHVGQAARLSSGAKLRKVVHTRSVVFGHGYFLRQNSPRAVGFESPGAQALAVTACSLTINLLEPCGTGGPPVQPSKLGKEVSAKNLAGGEDYGYFD